MGLDVLVALFVFAGLLFLMGIWLFYDRRDKAYYDLVRVRHVHNCVKCGSLYQSREQEKAVACPNCGQVNGRLRF